MRLIEPLGLVMGSAARDAIDAGTALPLAGGPSAFALAGLIDAAWPAGRRIVPVADIPDEFGPALMRLTARPTAWAGLAGAPPWIMGILNVTPDSFSDGGRLADAAAAVGAGLRMRDEGADIVDVGGESTRPGSRPVTADEEQQRVLPVVADLARQGVVVSVDTRNATTMRAALDAGARIINDVSGLAHDPEATPLIARQDCPVVLMHMRGTPATMGNFAHYRDVAVDVVRELAASVAAAEAAGISREAIAIDPGVGFAKNAGDNLLLLPRIGLLLNIGCAVLAGVSRKGFIGRLSGEAEADRRFPGSIAAGLHAVLNGVSILRVHDVAETAQAIRVWRGLVSPGDVPLRY